MYRSSSIPLHSGSGHLFIIILSLVVNDVEEPELVDALAGRDNPQPVSELLLLEKLLRPTQGCQQKSRHFLT